MKINILLADDHALVREGMRSLFTKDEAFGDIVEAVNGHDAVQMARKHHPDVVVMDYEMPNFNGIYATGEIMKDLPDTKVILVSAHMTREHVVEGIHAGIRGFLPKECRTSELIEAIKALHAGETWFRGEIAELIAPSLVDIVKNGRKVRRNGTLSPREKEITRMLATGMSPKNVAEKLCISKRTVDVHKSNIFRKLKINNISELVRYAIRQGMVKV